MGFFSADGCESVHRKYLKWLQGVKISTSNMAVYGETGRFPLFIDRYIRIVKIPSNTKRDFPKSIPFFAR